MSENPILDTSIHEPPPHAGEAEVLVFAVDRCRARFAWKCGGLTAAALRQHHPPSAMTLGGLVKHLATVEARCTAAYLTGQPLTPPWDSVDFDADPDWEWHSAADDSPAELYALWQGSVERSRAAIGRLLGTGNCGQPSKQSASGGESASLRRVLVELHDEYARHLGHADLLREAVDGLVGRDPAAMSG